MGNCRRPRRRWPSGRSPCRRCGRSVSAASTRPRRRGSSSTSRRACCSGRTPLGDPAAGRDPALAVVAVHEGGQPALRVVVAEVLDDVDLVAAAPGYMPVTGCIQKAPCWPRRRWNFTRAAASRTGRRSALGPDVATEAVGVLPGGGVAPADLAPGGRVGVQDHAKAHRAPAHPGRPRIALGARRAGSCSSARARGGSTPGRARTRRSRR